LEITSSCCVTERNMSWISIRRTVTVIGTCLSDFADSGLRIASSDVTRTARTSDWSVDASSSAKIARVDGARVAVIAVLCNIVTNSIRASSSGTCVRSNAKRSVSTASRWVESINGTCITIITAWNNNFTFVGRWVTLVVCASYRLANNCIVDTSSCRITMSCGTCRSSWASDRSGSNSENCITSVSNTLIWWFCCNQLSRDVSEDTVSSASIAAINSANALIVTDFADVSASSAGEIARISGTCIVIVTVDWSVDAISSVCITSVNSAFVSIIANNRGNDTFSRVCITRRWEAFVDSLALNWSEDTTRRSIASINSTCIVIVTKDWSLYKISVQAIARVGVAFILLSKSLQVKFSSVDASLNGITSFFGARIDITTNHWSVDTSSSVCIARVDGTCVVVLTALSFMNAISSGRVARVDSAWIVVITVLWISVDAVLGVTSRDGAMVCRSRNWNWSVDTVSIDASISSTCIVIVANHWSVNASSC